MKVIINLWSIFSRDNDGIHVPSNIPMESTPFNGMEFESDEIVYYFYNEYGRKASFTIRKECK